MHIIERFLNNCHLLSLQSSMLTCDKINRSHELHKVCTSYPEPVLTAAFESLKSRGIVNYAKMVNTTELVCLFTNKERQAFMIRYIMHVCS